jgi:CheY-like chemotaxis protein
MRLGFIITTATSNLAARRYLAEAHFDAIITDLGRRDRSDNGAQLIGDAKGACPAIPLIVYTLRADERRDELVAAGASAVEDKPETLIAVMLLIASSG